MRHAISALRAVLLMFALAAVLPACGDEGDSTPTPDPTPDMNPAPTPDPMPDMMPVPMPDMNPDPTPDTPQCEDDELSPNHGAEDAAEIAVGQEIEGLVICPDQPDFFTFPASEGERVVVNITFSHDEGDLDIAVFRSDDVEFEDPLALGQSVDDNESAPFVAPFDDDFIILVLGFEGASAGYSLSVENGCLLDAECAEGLHCDRRSESCRPYQEPACGADGELDPNGSDSRAIPVEFTEGLARVEGLSACVEDIDYFAMSLEKGDSLRIKLTPETQGAILGAFLQDAEGTILASAAEVDVEFQDLIAPHLPQGDYTLIVLLFQDEGTPSESAYAVEFTRTEGQCEEIDDCGEAEGRPFCVNGVCDSIEGNGEVALGASCDSDDDCGEDADLCFVDTPSAVGFICTTICRLNEQCQALGEGAYCNIEDGVCALPCTGDETCTETTFCNEGGQCITCGSDLECEGREEGEVCLVPSFGAGGLCGLPEVVECGGDDNEPNNTYTDATVLELVDGGASKAGLALCDADFDIFAIPVSETGTLRATVTYEGGSDLDLWILAEGQNREIGLGISTDMGTETAVAEFVPEGVYTLRVLQFPGDEDADTTYDLAIAFEAATCEDDSACEATSVRRLSCTEGACRDLKGNGEVEIGGACDTSDDCSLDADLCFQGEIEDSFNLCTIQCGSNEDCADIGGTVCTEAGFFAFCLPE